MCNIGRIRQVKLDLMFYIAWQNHKQTIGTETGIWTESTHAMMSGPVSCVVCQITELLKFCQSGKLNKLRWQKLHITGKSLNGTECTKHVSFGAVCRRRVRYFWWDVNHLVNYAL